MVLSLLNHAVKKRLAMEFRNDEIRFVEAAVKQGQIQKIVRMKQYPLPKEMKDGKIDSAGLAQTIKKWRKDNKWGTKHIHLTIPSTLIVVRKQELPNLSMSALRAIISQEIGSTIHLPFDNPIIDIIKIQNNEVNTEKNKIDTNQKEKKKREFTLFRKKTKEQKPEIIEQEAVDKSEVMIVAAPGDYIHPLVAALEEAGLKPLSIDIPALSLYRFIVPFDKSVKDQSILILSINKEDVDIHIVDKGVIRLSRNIPMNIHSYQKFNIDQEEQEKPGYETIYFNIEDHDFFDSYISDLSTELSRSVNFYERSMSSFAPIQKIFVTGQSLPSNKLTETLGERLGLPTRWILKPPMTKTLSDESYIGFATAIGLVMKENK